MRLTIALLTICCSFVAASAAFAKPLRLAGTKLTYKNNSTYKAEVTEAVRRWNASGTPLSLRPAARGKAASVTFVTKPSLTHQGRPVAGLGGIHFTKKRKPYGLVQLSAAALGVPGQTDGGDVDVVAHELGHALGLPHINQQCALMAPVGDFIRSICPSSSDTYRCGPQRVDAAALAKLYRGKLRWPADGGLCRVNDAGEFLEPAAGGVAQGSFIRVAVRNAGTRTWTQDNVALTFVDEAGQRAASSCGESMQISAEEPATAAGEVAHFGAMLCGTSGGSETVRVRLMDSDTETVFGPIHAFSVQH